MTPRPRACRRWAVLSALVGTLGALPAAVGALPAPVDAPDPATLLARVRSSQDVAFSGLGESSGSLALPDVRELSGLPSLLGDTTRARVWWRGPTAARVDVVRATGETDLVVDPAGSWTWESADRRAIRLQGEPAVRLPRADDLLAPSLGRRLARTDGLLPSALPPRRVAGVAAAGLRLAPPAGSPTTVGAVDLWVEPRSGLALRVEVTARGEAAASLTSRLLEVDLAVPPLVRVAFAPPRDAQVQEVDAPDLAAAIDRFAPYRLPDRLGGQPRRDLVGGLRSDGGVATYGTGLAAFAVVPLRGDTGRQVLHRIDPAATGRADVRTSLLSATVVAAGRRAYLLGGTVPPAVLDAAAAQLLADPPPRVVR